MRTHLRDEFELLLRIGAVDESELSEANRRGHEASFVRASRCPRPPRSQRPVDAGRRAGAVSSSHPVWRGPRYAPRPGCLKPGSSSTRP